jgi:hypothetical protein
MGGVQVLMFVAEPATDHSGDAEHRVHGYYRSGSDFRKDGQAVGW